MKNILKYALLVSIIGLLGYKSIYFKKLSDVKKESNKKFDAKLFSDKLWSDKMPVQMDSAVDLSVLIQAVNADKDAALKRYTNAIGIGNYRYAFIKTTGIVISVNEDDLQLNLPVGDSLMNAVLATEYIYGNAIRDASGLVDVKDFPNTADLNGISEELNKIIRTTILPSFKASIKKSDTVHITAAVELNKEHIKWNGLELLPVRLQIVQ